MTQNDRPWVDDVLDFWFKELTPPQWFKKDDAVDAIIRQRFASIHATVTTTPNATLLMNAKIALAAIIALDQFPRNIFRADPRAFASDAKALALAVAAVTNGLEQQCAQAQRLFIYLPFEHSEDPAMQVRSLALISSLGNPELTRYAEAHKVIIDRFGRFPHRNAVLGRATTPEEEAFLKEPLSSF
jgi:uncharacterized protein (DUF924 family)